MLKALGKNSKTRKEETGLSRAIQPVALKISPLADLSLSHLFSPHFLFILLFFFVLFFLALPDDEKLVANRWGPSFLVLR